jgi:N utilization substance protein A
MGYDEEEVAGRCAAILANGKRCPNASLPGSRYCGLPAHQALTDQETDYVVPPEEGANGGEPAEEPEEAPAEEPVAVEAEAEAPAEDAELAEAAAEEPAEEAEQP